MNKQTIKFSKHVFVTPRVICHIVRNTHKWYSLDLLTQQRLLQIRQISIAKDELKYVIQPISPIPTLHFQKSLPRLPIPDLQTTLKKYVSVVEPILNDKELET